MVSLINVVFAVLFIYSSSRKMSDRRVYHVDCPFTKQQQAWAILEFWFWSIAMAELRKVKPSDLEDLKQIVEGFSESLEEDKVMKRAKACKAADGGAFEYRLKNYKD